MASTICWYVIDREPPSASIAAVSDASPSFPAGSNAAPVMNMIRKTMSGDVPG